MIFCVCNNLNTEAVDRAHACGAQTACAVQRHCGKRFNCGQCRPAITDRLETLSQHASPVALAAE